MEVNGAAHRNHGASHRSDGPRELEIFSDEQVEDVMESLEYFKTKIEQLQLYCEQVNQSKLRSDEAVLEGKRRHQEEIAKYQEEVSLLRSINIQLMTGKVSSAEKRGNFSVSSLSNAIDCENAESRIQEMESQVRSLELILAEKEKHVSVMEWQLMDMEATIAALQAERDQLVLELELREAQENVVQGNDNLRAMATEEPGDDNYNFHEPSAKSETRRNKKRSPRRPHSDLCGTPCNNTQDNLTLKQLLSLSAEWSPKETPVRMRKPPQRHYSDYVKRDARARNADFAARGNTTHSLEDFDNISEVDSGLGLGKLTRTTNFCDILDADEYSNIHVTDNRLSFTGDLVLEERLNTDGEPESESSHESLAKKWETFDGERKSLEMSPGNGVTALEDVHTDGSNGNMFEDRSFSSTSDFSSAFCSSQDILMSSGDEVWKSFSTPGCDASSSKLHKKLSKKDISKSDSCIIATKSPTPEDMWNFTPDSILNVSTGEVLIPSVVETPPTPSLKKSRSFTSSIEIVLKSNHSDETKTSDENITGDESQTNKTETTSDKTDETATEAPIMNCEPADAVTKDNEVTLRVKETGASSRTKRSRKSKSVIECTDVENVTDSRHQKSHSDPVKDDVRDEPRKLVEYQKWRKYGRRGKPPGDLRISEGKLVDKLAVVPHRQSSRQHIDSC